MSKKNAHSSPKMRKSVSELHHYLLGWFDLAKREMPWRETRDPYAIWLSETMLQQTQVETVKPYYHKFLRAFPTVVDLAAADLQEVLRLWAGLGYYRRARHLHLAAQRMVELHKGRLPETVEALVSLPGIGRYTAGAVGSIAFGLKVPVVDGNVMRVLSRLTGFNGDIAEPKSAAFFWKVAGEVLDGAEEETRNNQEMQSKIENPKSKISLPRYGDINQAMMELGATVCVPPPGRPACLLCPVREFCVAFAEGRQMELPVKKKKGAVPVVRGVAVVITRNSKLKTQNAKPLARGVAVEDSHGGAEVLVMQRPRGVVWEEMWEFPVVEEGGGGNTKHETRNAKPGRKRGADKNNKSSHELQLGMSIKNGHGVELGVGIEAGAWVEGVVGVRVAGVVECGVVRHGLTHRAMEFRVVRGEMRNAEGGMPKGTDQSKIKNQKSKILLPVGVGMGGKRYVAWRWVKWPLVEKGEVPMGRVVGKVAEAARVGER